VSRPRQAALVEMDEDGGGEVGFDEYINWCMRQVWERGSVSA
jgi:hypothetical protein